MAEPWPEGVLAEFLAMPPPQNWSAHAWQTACRAVADGGSYLAAAQAASVSVNALIGAAHRRGFPVRPSPIRPAGSGGRPHQRKPRPPSARPRAGAVAVAFARDAAAQAPTPPMRSAAGA